MPEAAPPQDTPAVDTASAESAPESSGTLLLAVFWTWTALLAVITVSHLAGWDSVLDALDVKRWFAR